MKEKLFYLDFLSRKFHSLMGVLPLGLFIFEHLTVNSTAIYGANTFNQAVHYLHGLPFLWVLEIFLIALPLSYHAILGLFFAIQAVNNPGRYRYLRNWMFYLQRVSGLITFVFVIYHLIYLKFNYSLAYLSMYDKVAAQFDSAFGIIFYAIGLTAAVFHFSNGLWGFAINWGIITGPRAQKVFSYLTIAIFFLVNLIGYRMMLAFIV